MWAPAALAAGAVVLVLVVLGGGGDEPQTERPPAAATPAALEVDPLSYPRKGLRLSRPAAWSAKVRRSVIRLRSPDRRVAIAIATRPPGTGPAGALQEAVRAIREGYGKVRRLRRTSSTLGGRPAEVVELVARGSGGALVDVLVVGGASPWRSYAITAVSLRPTDRDTARRLGAVIDSVTFAPPAS